MMKQKKQKIWIGPQLSTIQNDMEMEFLSYYKTPVIVGLTGPTKSGKTIVARRLTSEHGFHYFNLSTFIREHARNLGQEKLSWENLKVIGEMLRTEFGDNIFARWTFERIRPLMVGGAKIVLDGVLHPSEVNYFHSITHFYLVGMVAPLDVRSKQAQRWFPHEFDTDDVIVNRDRYEHVSSTYKVRTTHAPNVLKCLELADFHIEIKDEFNDESVYLQADRIVNSIL